MTGPAIILGTFADLKTVKTRSVVQVVVEVPIEQGKQVVEAFGFPQPGAEIPVAVTRVEPVAVTEKSKRPGRPFADMPPSQQAGMLCTDSSFMRWANPDKPTHEGTRMAILNWCGISSRRQLNSEAPACRLWDAMLARFHADTGRTAEQRG